MRTRPLDPVRCAEIVAEDKWLQSLQASTDGCIVWTGNTNRDGYGVITRDGKTHMVHRVAYVAATQADIPDGLVIDHLCRNRPCVNLEHLEAVTQLVNAQRANVYATGKPRRLKCRRGHGATTFKPSEGIRRCVTCRREEFAKRRQVIREARHAIGMGLKDYLEQYGSNLDVARGIIEEGKSRL